MTRALLALLMLSACGMPHQPWHDAKVSWYGAEYRGRITASGDPFRPGHFTAASRTMPFGTAIMVENPANGRRVRVLVNDRGPARDDLDLDLSESAAKKLDILDKGIAKVRVTVLGCVMAYDGRDGCGRPLRRRRGR